MLCDYLFDMACLCEFVFICLCILYLGLEYVLIWFLIEFRSFRLLIHKVASPNDVATLLCILIRWVDFIVFFREDFSTIFQSFVVVVVREGVMVRNPKTDSKSEFGCPRYGWRTWGSAREASMAKGHALATTCGARGTHGQSTPLVPCGPRAPHGVLTWQPLIGSRHPLSSPSLFPPFIFEIPSRILYNFWFLILIISLSFQLWIEWVKSQNCWSWRELQTPSIFRAIWVRHFSQWSDFSTRLNFCMWNFFFSLHLLIISFNLPNW